MLEDTWELIGLLFINFIFLFVISRIYNKKIKYFGVNFISGLLFVTVSIFLTDKAIIPNFEFTKYFRVIFVLLYLCISNKLVFNKNIRKTIVSTLMAYIILTISEMLVVAIFTLLNEGLLMKLSKYADFIIGIAELLLSIKIGPYRFVYDKLLKYTNQIRFYKTILGILIIFILFFCPYIIIYYNKNVALVLLFLILIFLYFLILMLNEFKIRHDLFSTKEKYDNTLSSLIEYEKMIDKYRIDNHENKNQFLMIRNMVKRKEEGIENYIDKLVNNKMKDDDELLMKVSVIPSGGLRATIYTKLLTMKDKEIEYTFEIDRTIRSIELDFNDELILSICNIVNVFLDNAIEEVVNHEEGYIAIEMTMDMDNLIISIGNTCGNVKIDRIEEKGYTTKEKGHGYGLPMVKEIITKEKRLKNEKYVTEDFFTQVLLIDIKK